MGCSGKEYQVVGNFIHPWLYHRVFWVDIWVILYFINSGMYISSSLWLVILSQIDCLNPKFSGLLPYFRILNSTKEWYCFPYPPLFHVILFPAALFSFLLYNFFPRLINTLLYTTLHHFYELIQQILIIMKILQKQFCPPKM